MDFSQVQEPVPTKIGKLPGKKKSNKSKNQISKT